MKLQRRALRVGRRTWTVLTPRPGARAAFSTNRFHQTWHIVSDALGARLLARLLWGLAYQRQPRTLILLHGDMLRPTPFDADPSDPIVLANPDLGLPDVEVLRALPQRLPTASGGVVRLQTWGLDRPADWERDFPRWRRRALAAKESMVRLGGCLRYAACADGLRLTARLAQALSEPGSPWGTDHRYLADRHGWPEGELQTFDDYRRRVAVAAEARRRVTADETFDDPQRLREAVWDRVPRVARIRRASYRRRAVGSA